MSMPTCPSCIYAQGICEKTGVKISYSTGCTYHKQKPITNADRIRSMRDEEMAEFLAKSQKFGDIKLHYDGYYQLWLDWLKQEADK